MFGFKMKCASASVARKGTRPLVVRQQQYESAYIFGAVCAQRDAAVSLILPQANTEAMAHHLQALSEAVPAGRHAVRYMQRVVALFAHPQRGHRHDAVVDLAHRAQVLARHVISGAAVLAVSRNVDDENAVRRGASGRLGIPGSLGQEKLQPLHLGRLRCQRLGPIARQQQARQICAKAMVLGERLEKKIELELELTPFHGHLMVQTEGVRDEQIPNGVRAGVPPATH